MNGAKTGPADSRPTGEVPSKPLIDPFQRRISYLRLSVTDRFDLRCAYCMPERMTFMPRSDALTSEELLLIAGAFIDRGVTKIRLTGGEPLVRKDILGLVQALGRRLGEGLEELTITSNGTKLADAAASLFASGIRRVNVSLDTLDAANFGRLTMGGRLANVMEGIFAARDAGLKVKINVVALANGNEDETPSMIEWAHGEGFEVTLIEVMPLGETGTARRDQFLPLSQVRESLEQRWTLRPSSARSGGPARYFDIIETGGCLGMITPLTGNFCEGCNRVRVTAAGRLNMCLGGEEQEDLRNAARSLYPREALHEAISRALAGKRARHDFSISASGGLTRHMSATGG